MFSSLGFREHVETAHQTQRQTEAGLFVVARTKHADQVGKVILQTQDQNQVSPESPSERTQQSTRGLHQHMSTKDEPTTVISHNQIQTLPKLLEPEHYIHSPLDQSLKEAEPTIQPQSIYKTFAQVSGLSSNDQLLTFQAPVGPKCPKSPVPVVTTPVPEEKKSSSASQTHKSKSRIRGEPNTLQSVKTSPQPPVMVRSEVHSKAQSMARSRLDKARFRLQGRIQQAIRLHGGRKISESQAKRKQVQFWLLSGGK